MKQREAMEKKILFGNTNLGQHPAAQSSIAIYHLLYQMRKQIHEYTSAFIANVFVTHGHNPTDKLSFFIRIINHRRRLPFAVPTASFALAQIRGGVKKWLFHLELDTSHQSSINIKWISTRSMRFICIDRRQPRIADEFSIQFMLVFFHPFAWLRVSGRCHALFSIEMEGTFPIGRSKLREKCI